MPYNVLGAGSAGGYEIEQSLRFNNTGESVYLERTPSADGNKQVATLSFWIKNCGVSDSGGTDNTRIMYAGNSSSDVSIWQVTHTSPKFEINNYRAGPGNGYWTTDAVYRDPGAWYHYVVSYNQGTVNTYVNGELQSQSVTLGGWSGAVDTAFNSNGVLMVVGPKTTTASVKSIYLAEYHWIDGQALDASNFGETDLLTNQWIPKKYVGTYGTNGFYLNFSDSASLGADSSGNGNNFTPTNLAATDQVLDSPTNNFATLNPLWSTSGGVFSEGNLKSSLTADSVTGSIANLSGKYYYECYALSSSGLYIGISDDTLFLDDSSFTYNQVYVYIGSNGYKGGNGSAVAYGSTYTTGDIIGVAYDLNSGSITFYKNGISQGTAFSSGFAGAYRPFIHGASTSNIVANFGQDSSFAGNKTAQNNTDSNGKGDFYYAPPSGYLALCEDNLPDPSIALPGDYFNTVSYTGNGTAIGSGGLTVTGVGFQPDFTWVKQRNTIRSHNLYNSVMGVTKRLESNNTDAEATDAESLSSWNSDGFVVGNRNSVNNSSSDTYVSWNWKADNTSGSTNTDGTITSTVSANPTAGFSIVSYTGNTATDTNYTVGHGLSQTPDLLIIKNRDWASSVGAWMTWHTSIGNNTLRLDTSDATNSGDFTKFLNQQPNSTVFTVRADTSVTTANRYRTNGQVNNYIAYCFHSVEGYSKIGSYTGNGNADGTFVYTGFRPAFVIIKRYDASADNWHIIDTSRDPINVSTHRLKADVADAESSTDTSVDFVSNGFKHRSTSGARNASGGNYIYMAFAESPFKYSNAR